MSFRARTAACLVWAALALASALEAQVVRGRVVLMPADSPVSDVTVRLDFPDGRPASSTVTDSEGGFVLFAPRLGAFTLSATRIGLASVVLPGFQVRLSEEVDVVLRMSEEAVPLEPLVVNARSALRLGPLAGYFERMERNRTLGFGHIRSRDEIQERDALQVADLLLDIPRVRVLSGERGRPPRIVFTARGGECTPKVFVDGIHQNRGGAAGTAAVVDEVVRPHELEGLEVYRGPGEMPGEYYDEGHCGVILLWTRRDADGGRPNAGIRILVVIAALAAVVLTVGR